MKLPRKQPDKSRKLEVLCVTRISSLNQDKHSQREQQRSFAVGFPRPHGNAQSLHGPSTLRR